MATLNFDATSVPPAQGDNDDIPVFTPSAKPDERYDLRPVSQAGYIEACQQRKAIIEYHRNAWKAAVAELNKQRELTQLARDAFSAAKALPQPRPPYIDIVTSGGALDTEVI